MAMRKRVLAAVMVVAAAAAVVYLIARPGPASGEWLEGSGVVEATEVDVSALVGGRLVRVLVGEGDSVGPDDIVAEIEREELQAGANQAQGAAATARAELARSEAIEAGAKLAAGNARSSYEKSTELKGQYEAAQTSYQAAVAASDQAAAKLDLVLKGTRREQLDQVRAAVDAAEAQASDARRELARLARLEAEGGVARQQVDRQRSATEAAEAGLAAARARLEEAEAGAREEERRQAEAALHQAQWNVETAARSLATAKKLYEDRLVLKQQLDAAEAQQRAAVEAMAAAEGLVVSAEAAVAAAEKRVRDATVRSPMAGVVTLKIREPGETVAPGQAIVRVADLERMWLRVYVPETEVDRVKLGQEAEVRTDADPDKVHRGRVTEIAQEAEFTPKNVQTKEQRTKLVFGVKVELENPEGELKPGMPAEARIRVGLR